MPPLPPRWDCWACCCSFTISTISSGTRRYLIYEGFSSTHVILLPRDFTHVIPSDIAFGQPPEFVSFRARLHDFFQSQIHVGIAIHKMSVQRLAIFELDEHRMALRRGEETEWKLESRIISACVVSQYACVVPLKCIAYHIGGG